MTTTHPAPASDLDAKIEAMQDLRIFGGDYVAQREGDGIRITGESGESHVFFWDAVRGILIGPSYARVPGDFRAQVAAKLRDLGWLVPAGVSRLDAAARERRLSLAFAARTFVQVPDYLLLYRGPVGRYVLRWAGMP